ncbi:Holliday junction branch migration protein RuvA [Natronospirillum operosum]|uniref:Holliday junction branch migration complex subunit RuvA n=1 Tax=Natronospirillum operosum TaxID=2759953 RepID=A0A4Z0W8P2_9GAMM|nr:Holliday junction branch migration protein RuvA [Natronospirillum operosum]TGG93927.1 Holliday junction branch migration protein RuvA [Natronospirillum operosum]
MIGHLKGTLSAKQPPEILLDVQGVGYELLVPMTTYYQLPATGEPVSLWTHLSVREDAHTLFGFAQEGERRLFRTLIKVNGIGPKLALSILSAIEPDDFARYIEQESVNQLVKIPGVGKKMAERLVLELKGKLTHADGTAAELGGLAAAMAEGGDPVDDAESALIALGYKPVQAAKMIKQVRQPGLGSDDLIRLALKSAL